jgi:ABC-type proline/glycine betaine transport system ATPase subunit
MHSLRTLLYMCYPDFVQNTEKIKVYVNKKCMQNINVHNIKPDIDNSKLPLCCMQQELQNQTTYDKHLNTTHSMFVTNEVAKKDESTVLNVDDLNYQCNGCKRVFCNKSSGI